MKKANLAVIGTGGLAQNQHIPNITMSRNANLKTLCDLRVEVLEELGAYYGVSNLETDYKKVLNDPEVDGVVIVTKEDSHIPLTMEALEAGKHVYVEKPLAETEKPCKQVIDLQEQVGKVVIVGMNRRMAPSYQQAKEILQRNGGPKNIFYRISDSYCLTWGKGNPGGQRVIHEICHIFDILRFFTESEVTSVYSLRVRDDDEQFVLQFKNGSVATIVSSGYVNIDMPKEYLEAIADIGSVTVEDFVEMRTYSMPDEEDVTCFTGHVHPTRDWTHAGMFKNMGLDALRSVRKTAWRNTINMEKMQQENDNSSKEFRLTDTYLDQHSPLINYCMDKGWLGAIEHFADCILTGCEVQAATAYDGLIAARITDAAIESRESGNVVYL